MNNFLIHEKIQMPEDFLKKPQLPDGTDVFYLLSDGRSETAKQTV